MSFEFGEDEASRVPLQTGLAEPQGASCVCAGHAGVVWFHCRPGSPTAGGPAARAAALGPPGLGFLRAASRSHDSRVPAGDQALCCVLENVSRPFFQAVFTEHCVRAVFVNKTKALPWKSLYSSGRRQILTPLNGDTRRGARAGERMRPQRWQEGGHRAGRSALPTCVGPPPE